MRTFQRLVKTIGIWYDSLDLRRLTDPAYRNLSVNRLARDIEAILADTEE